MLIPGSSTCCNERERGGLSVRGAGERQRGMGGEPRRAPGRGKAITGGRGGDGVRGRFLRTEEPCLPPHSSPRKTRKINNDNNNKKRTKIHPTPSGLALPSPTPGRPPASLSASPARPLPAAGEHKEAPAPHRRGDPSRARPGRAPAPPGSPLLSARTFAHWRLQMGFCAPAPQRD